MTIIVLGGGVSPERDVSIRSAKSVAAAARDAGYDVIEADPKDGLGVLNDLGDDVIVFPILHGAGGEDGILQAELEKRHIKFLGTGSAASKNCFDKWLTREILQKNSISIPKGELVTADTYRQSQLSKKSHVLKTPKGGSSIGTYVVRNPNNTNQDKIAEIFSMGEKAVLEELITGTEITVPVLGETALPIIEIRPPNNGEFDYGNKYNGATQELCPPESVSADIQESAARLAEKVHRVMNARHLSRTDIMIDEYNSLYVLEINTIPGMTDQSLYPKSARVYGLSMPELIKKFVELVG